MTAHIPADHVSRRAAFMGISALGLTAALGQSTVLGQEATPLPTVGHPLVGTWVVDRVPDESTEPPTLIICTSDGIVFDPLGATGGAWQATGPRSAAWTLVGLFDGGSAGYLLVRTAVDVDDAGMAYSGTSSITLVNPDGSIQGTFPATPRANRMPIEPVEAGGTPLAGFPTWTPSPPAEASPAS
jgi:hypothetical protein